MLLLHISAISFGHQREPPALPGGKIAYGEGQSRQEKVSELE